MIIFEAVVLIYCIYFVSYALFFSVGGHFYRKPSLNNHETEFVRFAVLIPGYKEDAIIEDTIKNNLKVDYPKDKFDIVAIADSYSEETLAGLQKYPIKLQEVSFEKSTKVKALKYTLERLDDQYDYIVILDADNLMEEDYLRKVNSFLLSSGSKAVQTQRWPKNENNDLAVLDGISESINNHIYRQGASATGFSVSLSGSGMVFERHLFQQEILQMDSIGGFDRELEFKLLEKGTKVVYFKEARVFDQKTDSHGNFTNQRTRWISSQYVYLFRFLKKGVYRLLKGDIVYFHSTVWRNIQLPRLINLGLLTILTLLAIIFSDFISFSFLLWVGLWVLNAMSLAISIPRKLYNKRLLFSIFKLPKLFLSMFLILFRLKGANKKFIHTEHKAV